MARKNRFYTGLARQQLRNEGVRYVGESWLLLAFGKHIWRSSLRQGAKWGLFALGLGAGFALGVLL